MRQDFLSPLSQADADERGGHRHRFQEHFDGERQAPDRGAEARPDDGGETDLDEPNRQPNSGAVKPASRKVRKVRFQLFVEKGSVGDTDRKAYDQGDHCKSSEPGMTFSPP